MNNISYLLDENVDPILRTELLRHDSDLTVWQVGMLGAPEFGTLDPEILIWCEENSFVLVTNNRKSMPVHLQDHLTQGRHTPGIFTLSSEMSLGEMIEELLLIASASFKGEFQDQIIYLPIS